MAYVSLYRKYRPRTFDDVIGQSHIVRTLRNQILNDSISHAYLFTGTRGTGKTSCAKIFAKAVNCAEPVDGSPCGHCEACRSIAAGSNFDVLEIDAASNNGVDEIRDLRDMVKYPPASLKKKVFIIDEVHMLSASAYNALLKTLEEPPEYAVFILATTEVHKIPATIMSRCMRFDFRLVSNAELAKRLEYIFSDVGRRAEKGAIDAIAEAGDGSVRDALSIADMCLSYTSDTITQNDVLEILGASSPVFTAKILSEILSDNTSGALEAVTELADNGKNISLLAADLAKAARNTLFVKLCADARKTLGISEEVYGILNDAAEKHSQQRICGVLETLSGTEQKLRLTSQPRIILEAAVVRACTTPLASDEDVMTRLAEIERKIKSGAIAAPTQKAAVSLDSVKVMGVLIRRLREQKRFALYSSVAADATKSEYSDGVFSIIAGKKSDFDVLNDKDNLKVMTEILMREFGVGRLEIGLSEKTVQDIASDVGKISSMFDSAITTIKK